MTDQELEQRLAKAISHAAPDDLQGVLSRCETRKGNVIPMTTRRKNPWARNLIAACLALALVGGGVVWQQANAVTSVVSLDVNPSIELNVNKNGKVLSCEGLNEEARDVLTDMNGGADLKGTKLDVAVNAIVGALVRSGYLDSISSAILISVEDADRTRASRLQQELTAAVDGVLQKESSGAAVLSQTLEKNADIEKQAKENNISTGKAALISRVMVLNSSLTFEGLSNLSVEELKDLTETGAPGIPIGKNEAAARAIQYAGVGSSVTYYRIDAELDDNPAHYEVELYTSAGDFEYEVEAYTGAVLNGKADVLSEERIDRLPAGGAGERIGGKKAFVIAEDDFFTRYPNAKGNSKTQSGSVELDEYDGRLHYDVKFYVKGYEADYEIDAYTGEILTWEVEHEGTVDREKKTNTAGNSQGAVSISAGNSADIGSDAAKAVALSHAGLTEAQVTDLRVEKDRDDGRVEYEVEFRAKGMEYEYTIDAATGAVLEHEKDRDD